MIKILYHNKSHAPTTFTVWETHQIDMAANLALPKRWWDFDITIYLLTSGTLSSKTLSARIQVMNTMSQYCGFSEEDFTYVVRIWRQSGIRGAKITMGPLKINLDLNIFRSTIDIVASECDQVNPGSLEWYDSKYMLFRCIYGVMRLNGKSDWEWEIPNEFGGSHLPLYQKTIRGVPTSYPCKTSFHVRGAYCHWKLLF